MQAFVEQFWYEQLPKHWLWGRWLLWPFSWVFRAVALARKCYLQKKQKPLPVPVIVVGNLTVGGAGKTPFVIALAKACTEKGLAVGIISRGYRAAQRVFPYEVSPQDEATWVGDEPLLLACRTGCPVVIAPKRVDAAIYLLKHHACDLIISDDGLQHYALSRQIEIMVIDGMRGLGNGMCLPAGPLREPKKRLQQVDFVIVNQGSPDAYGQDAFSMQLQGNLLKSIMNQTIAVPSELPMPVAAVAGIGNPDRFFSTLNALGIRHIPYPFPDHFHFNAADIPTKEKIVIMTEKDAVKCQAFAAPNWYYLSVDAVLDESFWQVFWTHQQLTGFKQ